MTPYSPTSSESDFLYQSLLGVEDTQGTKVILPVTARGLSSNSGSIGDGSQALVSSSDNEGGIDRSGALGRDCGDQCCKPTVVGHQSQHARCQQQITPSFRVIVHVDAAGQAKLLQNVLLMWKNGVSDVDGRLVEPGRYVLVTDEERVPDFTGAVLRDGHPVAHRISSTAFGFDDPITMTGSLGASDSTLSCDVTLGYSDPLNPFVHRYHPDHDNLDRRFEEDLGAAKSHLTLNGKFRLSFRDVSGQRISARVG